MADWERYEEQVAELFRELGCSAEVGASVEGVRSTHKVDVWVVFKRFGLEQNWAVECKYWKDRTVEKEKVLALRSIVADVGADKGILVAEFGFQPGAVSAATSTNILLTSLSNLRSRAMDDLQNVLLEDLERKVIDLRERHHNLWENVGSGPGHTVLRLRPGVESNRTGEPMTRVSVRLGMVDEGFKQIKRRRFPAAAGFDFDAERVVRATDKQEFLELAGETVQSVEDWVKRQEDNIEATLQEDRDRN